MYHLVGDEKFSQFLATQPLAFRVMVRNAILYYTPMPPVTEYLHRHFPETTKTVMPGEIVDWHSPDGSYAIRKVFSDRFALYGSKVARAELIERSTNDLLCELTQADIGTGAHREGEVLWSPDSRRFAYLSTDLSSSGNTSGEPTPAPQKKQTILFEVTGDSCQRIEIAPTSPPDRADDRELDRAILGHEHTEPLRWINADTLVLQRHEYYQRLRPRQIEKVQFNEVQSFDRLYEITVEIEDERTATAHWDRKRDE